jgi:hypothetical protein
MKIHSAYLENNIPEKPAKIRQPLAPNQVKQDNSVQPNQTKDVKKTGQKQVTLELSDVTQRILSNNEKKVIAALFSQNEEKYSHSYQRNGKTSNMDIHVGKKIDIRG